MVTAITGPHGSAQNAAHRIPLGVCHENIESGLECRLRLTVCSLEMNVMVRPLGTELMDRKPMCVLPFHVDVHSDELWQK